MGSAEKGHILLVKALYRSVALCRTLVVRDHIRFGGLLMPVLLTSSLGSWSSLADSADDRSAMRGEYVYHLAGCESCHTDSANQELGPAGGVALETPFGTFYAPNITPDKATGIGNWGDKQFIDAIRNGVSPDGTHYYPAFPYTSYTKMTDGDVLDLKAYLDSLKPVARESTGHVLVFPFDQRWLMGLWKRLFFDRHPFQPLASRTKTWNRGNYIVNGPGHCVECHTPRNLFGGLRYEALLTGNPDGPEGESVPPIDGVHSRSFGRWSLKDIVFALQSGMLPDGDFIGGSMGHVVENSTSRLSDADLRAVAEYLLSPAPGEDRGILSRLLGAGDATADDAQAIGEGSSMTTGGFFLWLVWFGLIPGIIWLAARLLRRSR